MTCICREDNMLTLLERRRRTQHGWISSFRSILDAIEYRPKLLEWPLVFVIELTPSFNRIVQNSSDVHKDLLDNVPILGEI